jgi:pimeloyl-ACP methyl ester carboxylesterase
MQIPGPQQSVIPAGVDTQPDATTGGGSSILPFERRVGLACGETFYLEAGRGRPVVLLHGLMATSFSWRKNISALAAHFHVFALDFAGCGLSGPLLAGQYGVERWSRQLEEFLDFIGAKKVLLIASSAGGAVALDFASRCPGRVEAMILVAPVTPYSRRVMFLARLYSASGMPSPVLRALLRIAPKLVPWLLRHRYYADPRRVNPATIRGYIDGLRNQSTVRMLRESIRAWNPRRQKEQMSRIKSPLLLLWGEDDKLVPASCIPRLIKALPHASLATIPNAGHLLFEEIPESFHEQVLKFFGKAPDR